MIQEMANHLWQSTLFAGVIAILCYSLRNDGAYLRYRLWWLASIKFVVPFAVLTAIGKRLAGGTVIPGMPDTFTTTAVVVARPFTATAEIWSPTYSLLALWAAGSFLLLARWVLRAQRLRRVLALATPGKPLCLDGGPPLPVLRTAERIEPGIVGIVRPAVLLPRDIEAQLSAAQLDAVLTHELGHVRRQDNLTAAVHMLVEVAFWFHPLVWWIGARLLEERERACDELVVAAGHDRETYAAGMLDVCELYAATPLRCAAGISGQDLKRRVTHIMRVKSMNRLKPAKRLLLASASVAALAIPLLAGLLTQTVAIAQDVRSAPDTANTDYLPIVMQAPIYPPRAAQQGLEGYVIVSYTVTTTGTTTNVVVLESSSSLFERATIESVQRYKYMPRVVNNTPVSVDDVRTRIEFELDPGDGELPVNPGTNRSDQAGTAGETEVGRPAGELIIVTGTPIRHEDLAIPAD